DHNARLERRTLVVRLARPNRIERASKDHTSQHVVGHARHGGPQLWSQRRLRTVVKRRAFLADFGNELNQAVDIAVDDGLALRAAGAAEIADQALGVLVEPRLRPGEVQHGTGVVYKIEHDLAAPGVSDM